MSMYGWVAIGILLLIISSAGIKMFTRAPESKEGKHVLALSPIFLGVVFVLLPDDIVYNNESVSALTKIIIPFICLTISLPLVYKAKQEINKTE